MDTFRIGHISDLHFSQVADRLNPLEAAGTEGISAKSKSAISALMSGKGFRYPSTFNRSVALGLLESMPASFNDLDTLLVTGDLATTGLDADLSIARNYFLGSVPTEWNPLGAVPSLRDELPFPILFLPGNHDRYEGSIHSPTASAFERHFGEFWDLGSDKVGRVAGTGGRVMVTILKKGQSALVIVLADLALKDIWAGDGFLGWVGQGKALEAVTREIVRTTRVALARAGGAGLNAAALWAVHFPPLFPEIKPSLDLLQSDLLLEAARSCGVSLLLAGHTHIAAAYSIPAPKASGGVGGTTIHCSGATTGISSHGRYSLSVLDVDIAGDRIADVKRCDYEWDWTEKEFLAA